VKQELKFVQFHFLIPFILLYIRIIATHCVCTTNDTFLSAAWVLLAYLSHKRPYHRGDRLKLQMQGAKSLLLELFLAR
jgi:hypothetical protein